MLSLLWFALYLMDRLIHVKNVELSTPRGFFTTVRNSSADSYSFSLSLSSPPPSPSSSSDSETMRPTITITFTDNNVLEAFKTMNFHRSKMNEYLCDDFIATKINSNVERVLDSDTDGKNIANKLIQDEGSNSYKIWLTRTMPDRSTQNRRISTQPNQVFGYTESHLEKPFYKLRNSTSLAYYAGNNNNSKPEDEDIYFGMSFPAYHETQRKQLNSVVTPRDTFQRSDPSPNYYGQQSNKETIAIYVTQSDNSPSGQSTTDNNVYWTSDGNVESSNHNSWMGYGNDDMQRNPQIPAPDIAVNNELFNGYSYTTMPPMQMDNNPTPYTQHHQPIMESAREYTYPPYYPPSDIANGYNAPVYGYSGTSSSSTTTAPQLLPPQYTYQPPVTSSLYGYQPQITSWPYGWTPSTTTTTMPFVHGWMPTTTPMPVNTPPSPSPLPMTPMPAMTPMNPMMPMVPMVPMVPMMPTYANHPATQTQMSLPSYAPSPPPSMSYGYQPTPPPMSYIYQPAHPPMSYGYQLTPPPVSYGYQPAPQPATAYGPPTPLPAPLPAYGPPSTSTPLPYGADYTFNPPNNQNPHSDSEHPPWWLDHPKPDHPPHDHAWPDHPWPNHPWSNEDDNDGAPSDYTDYDLQDPQDFRDNSISNFLGPETYELILTAIAFMAFGTYFMNMMMQITQGNSSPTMMIIENGAGNSGGIAPANGDSNFRKFSNESDLQLLNNVLTSIDDFHNWLIGNSTDED